MMPKEKSPLHVEVFAWGIILGCLVAMGALGVVVLGIVVRLFRWVSGL